MTDTTPALDQTVTIEHGMDGALGRNRNIGKPAQQAFANFPCTPTGVFTLDVQNEVLHLKGKLVGVAIGAATAVGQALHAAFLITVEDFIAGLAGDPKLTAQL